MASKQRDMRRAELIIPWVDPENEKKADMGSTLGQTMPMAAMFTRQKMIGWVSMVFSIQNWLAETPEASKTSGYPGYLSIGMSVMALGVCYMPLFMPPQGGARPATGTNPQAPVPPPH